MMAMSLILVIMRFSKLIFDGVELKYSVNYEIIPKLIGPLNIVNFHSYLDKFKFLYFIIKKLKRRTSMQEKFLEKIFQKVDTIKSESKIIFFKGFDIQTLNKVFEIYPRFHEGNYLTGEGLDIVQLNDEKRVLLTSFLMLQEGTYSGLYEEFIFLSDRISGLYKGDIIVIENNFFDNLYPNPYVSSNKELLKKYMEFLDKEEVGEDEDFGEITEYIANVIELGDQLFVSYVDRTEEIQVSKIDLIDCSILDISLSEVEELESYTEFSPANIYDLLELKHKIINGQLPVNSTINILTEKSILKTTELLNSLKTLAIMLGQDYNINFYYTTKFTRKEVREEFRELLKTYWNSNDFRMLDFYENPDESIEKVKISQGELIETIVKQVEAAQESDNYSDIFITAPTGAGKSVLFQIPAIYLAQKRDLVTIVISPLKALMVDQVRQLKEKGINFVEFINSDLTQREKENVIQSIKDGQVSILYVSPEFLLAYDIRSIIGEKRQLGLLIIDEAHLVTTWGRDFRVDYWYLGTYLKKLRNNNLYNFGNFVIASFTATAVYGGNDDMVYETLDSLYMKNPIRFLGNTRRTNIKFDIRNWDIYKSYQEERQQKTLDNIVNYIDSNKKTIVYAPYRRQIDELMDMVPREYGSKVVKYYGGLDSTYKDFYEEKFRTGESNVMLATKAFGMGVDVSDIEIVYHHAPTGNLCDYVQEIGRAGRDQTMVGLAIQDFNPRDLSFSKILYGLSSMKQYQLKEIIRKLYSIYRKERRRNFLINAETFSYLFPDEEDYENKIKNALLLIEKDLEKRYTYPVVIVRPKSLFSKAYAAVPSTIEERFKKSKYYPYSKKISEAQSSNIYNQQTSGGNITIQDIGPIYEFDLKQLWEEHYSDMTFPMLKKKFYDLELFDFKEKITPRYKLTMTLDKSVLDTKKELEENIATITKCFDTQMKGFFTREDFSEILKPFFPEEVVRRKITSTFIDLFVIKYGEENRNKFIQKRTNNGKSDREEFRLQSKHYHRVFRDVLNKYNDLTKDLIGDERILFRYLAIKDNSLYMTLAYIIEAFSLGSYDVRGGESPEIFIRVNDPSKLRVLSAENSRYRNAILRDIKDRQRRSGEILHKFFTELSGDEARWDFIEEYFLGRINLD